MKKTEFREICELNDRLNMYEVDTDPKYIKINKTPGQFEEDRGGSMLDHVTYAANYFHEHFPDIPIKAYFVSFWNGAIHLYTLPILVFKARPEDYLNECWCLFCSNVKGKKGGINFGVYSGYQAPESIISHEIFTIHSNPVNSDQHLHAATAYTYEFNPLDKGLFGMSDMMTLNWMKTQKMIGFLPGKDFPVGAPPRSKSARRANEINKIFRYNKYNLTTRAFEKLQGIQDSEDVQSFKRDQLSALYNQNNSLNGAEAAKV